MPIGLYIVGHAYSFHRIINGKIIYPKYYQTKLIYITIENAWGLPCCYMYKLYRRVHEYVLNLVYSLPSSHISQAAVTTDLEPICGSIALVDKSIIRSINRNEQMSGQSQ